MGSYGIIVKTEEVRRRVQMGDYDSAQRIIDTLPLKKVKNIADLTLFAEIFVQNKRYDEAMELLYRIYSKSRTRRVLNLMVVASIGCKNIEESERLLNEYKSIAPNDYNYYIYRYKIDKLKKEPYDVLINSLKQLKKHIYLEKWMYELAKLYYKAGMEKECIQECSDIILIFGEGNYVEKAKILKAYYSGEISKEEILKKLKSRTGMDNEMPGHNAAMNEESGTGRLNQMPDEKSACISDGESKGEEKPEKKQNEDFTEGRDQPEITGTYEEQEQPVYTGHYEGEGQPGYMGSYEGEGEPRYTGPYEGHGQSVYTGSYEEQGQPVYTGPYEGHGQRVYTGPYEEQGQPVYTGPYEGEGQPGNMHPYEGHGQHGYMGPYEGHGQPMYAGPYEEQGQPGYIGTYEGHTGNISASGGQGQPGEMASSEAGPLIENEKIPDRIKESIKAGAESGNDREISGSETGQYETNEDLKRLDRLAGDLNINLRFIFGNFIHVNGLQRQLVNCLESIKDEHTECVRVMITGAHYSGKTTLAKEIAIFLNKAGKLKTSKIIRLSTEKLNEIDITRIEEIRYCCLVLENSGKLKWPAVKKILELVEYFDEDTAVIFEDSRENADRLLREYPELKKKFKNRIDIPPYSEDDLIKIAYADILLRGYKLHPSAEEVFKNGLYEIIHHGNKEKVLKRISEYVRNSMMYANIRTGTENMQAAYPVTLLAEDFPDQIIS